MTARRCCRKYQGAEWFDGTVPEPTAADGTKEPIKVGFMNVDSGPVGAMPELHSSTDGAIEFINTELGGVDGRPIEIVPCLVSNPMSPDESQACARQLVDADVVAVLGGIGLSNGPALKVFEENGIPWVGGIPVNVDEMTSPVSFQFSGGSPGAFTAFAQDAVQEEGAKKVAVLYAEYPSIEQAAVGYGAAVAEALGAEVTKVSFPVVSQDYVAPVQKAVESNPDAIFVGAADLACAPIMQAIVRPEEHGNRVHGRLVRGCEAASTRWARTRSPGSGSTSRTASTRRPRTWPTPRSTTRPWGSTTRRPRPARRPPCRSAAP